MGDPRTLRAGVDTLPCTVRGELQDGLLVFLEALTDGEQSLSVALLTHGGRSYPFWASSHNIEVAISAAAPFLPVVISAHSALGSVPQE